MDQSFCSDWGYILVYQLPFLVRSLIKNGLITFFLKYLLNEHLAFVIFDAGSEAILTKNVLKDFCNSTFVYDYHFFNATVFAALAFALKVTSDLMPLQNFKSLWNIFGNSFDEFLLIFCYFKREFHDSVAWKVCQNFSLKIEFAYESPMV